MNIGARDRGVDSGSGIGALKWYLEEGWISKRYLMSIYGRVVEMVLRRILNRLPEILESGADVRYIAEDVSKERGKNYLVANGRVFLESSLRFRNVRGTSW